MVYKWCSLDRQILTSNVIWISFRCIYLIHWFCLLLVTRRISVNWRRDRGYSLVKYRSVLLTKGLRQVNSGQLNACGRFYHVDIELLAHDLRRIRQLLLPVFWLHFLFFTQNWRCTLEAASDAVFSTQHVPIVAHCRRSSHWGWSSCRVFDHVLNCVIIDRAVFFIFSN